jgi:plastocyanin
VKQFVLNQLPSRPTSLLHRAFGINANSTPICNRRFSMNIAMTGSHSETDKRLAALGKLTVGTLIGIAIMFAYFQAVVLKQIEMPLPILSAIALVLATMVAGYPLGGWRWTPILGASWSGLMIAGNLDHIRYDLVHPENTHVFAWTLVMLGLTVVGIVAGISATVQNYRYAAPDRRTPPWVPWGLTTVGALVVGAILVAAIPQTGSGAQVSPAVLEQLPAITLNAFNEGEIRVKAGQLAAFRLENPAAVGHSFDVDELSVHISMPSESHSLALFTADKPGTYTFYCAPHYDKGSGRGMHGTLIVEP